MLSKHDMYYITILYVLYSTYYETFTCRFSYKNHYTYKLLKVAQPLNGRMSSNFAREAAKADASVGWGGQMTPPLNFGPEVN